MIETTSQGYVRSRAGNLLPCVEPTCITAENLDEVRQLLKGLSDGAKPYIGGCEMIFVTRVTLHQQSAPKPKPQTGDGDGDGHHY